MYTSVTLIQQKIGRTLTADEASFADAVAIPAIDEWINNYLGLKFDDANGALIRMTKGDTAAVYAGVFATITAVEEMDAEGNATTIDANSYYYDSPYLFTYTGKKMLSGHNPNRLKITGTYADVPAGLRLAATIMASKPLTFKGGREIDSEKIGDYQVTYSNLTTQAGVASLADDDVMTLLAQYKPIRLA